MFTAETVLIRYGDTSQMSNNSNSSDPGPRIYVAGHTGMVGSAIDRKLSSENYSVVKPAQRVDLTNQASVSALVAELKPDWIFVAAARVGGISANSTYPADFIYANLMIECNLMRAAFENNVKKLLFLGSSCIYPRNCPQPIKEEYLLSDYLEATNKPYAVAKIAGIIMAQSFHTQYGCNFISVMPSNLYGPNDNFDLRDSHVIPALLRKTHEARMSGAPYVEVWGSGKPYREFLHVDDLADACLFLMKNYDSPDLINIGSGKDQTISELAQMIKKVVGYSGEIRFNADMPDGTPRKLLDTSKIEKLGWMPSIDMVNGLRSVYQWYLENEGRARK